MDLVEEQDPGLDLLRHREAEPRAHSLRVRGDGILERVAEGAPPLTSASARFDSLRVRPPSTPSNIAFSRPVRKLWIKPASIASSDSTPPVYAQASLVRYVDTGEQCVGGVACRSRFGR